MPFNDLSMYTSNIGSHKDSVEQHLCINNHKVDEGVLLYEDIQTFLLVIYLRHRHSKTKLFIFTNSLAVIFPFILIFASILPVYTYKMLV